MAGVSRRTEVIVNAVVCVGAAVVIFGAWAKILHKPFADIMLTIGLMTEAFIFIVYAFLPPAPSHAPEIDVKGKTGNPALDSIDDMLHKAAITPTNLQKLSAGFQRLGDTVDNMKEIGDVVKSTGDFSANTKSAADAMLSVKDTMNKTAGSLASFNQASEGSQQFHIQVQTLTKNLSSLNAVYELELQDTNNHLKAMNSFFGNLSAVSESMKGSISDAQRAKDQIEVLAKNLTSLNAVYGNMLNAMQVK